MTGDLVIAAFFSADKEKKRIEKLSDLAQRLVLYLGPQAKLDERMILDAEIKKLRSGDKPIFPFHWEVEFPEVFARENGGFDAMVGNPPFAGRSTLYESHREGYIDWLKSIHEESHGNADLVAHFYRRAFNLLRKDGCFGLIATNTIGQGDTRSTGLRWICKHGGTIFVARRRYKWPGVAAVVISVVHISKGMLPPPFELDGKSVPIITAYLFHAGKHDNPKVIISNIGKCFQGCVVVGIGFTFDDTDSSGIANPISLMRDLINKNPQNADRIFPYIGGEEVNDNPKHSHHRYIINFSDFDEIYVRNNWPDLIKIVEEKVRPEREQRAIFGSSAKKKRAENWWQFSSNAKELYELIHKKEYIFVCPIITNKLKFVLLPTNMVFSHKLAVFIFDKFSAFALLQCQCHQMWTNIFSSTMKDDINYSITDCFETFPFPENYENSERLEAVGKEYYEFRAQLMIKNNEGLTKTYNRFHDPDETSPEILRLRELHAAMDRAVLDAYGWTDLEPTCEFLLDYEEEEEEDEAPRRRKKPWRCRWPDDFRDEVLARLLELNKQRAEQERLAGLAAEPSKTRGKKKTANAADSKRKRKINQQPDLLDV